MANDSFWQINQVLAKYTKDINTALDEAMSSVAKEAKKELQNKSPKREGTFAKSWAIKHTKGEYTVYNKEYQLTHLLENGHDVVAHGQKVGHVDGDHFVAPINEWVQKEVIQRLEEKL